MNHATKRARFLIPAMLGMLSFAMASACGGDGTDETSAGDGDAGSGGLAGDGDGDDGDGAGGTVSGDGGTGGEAAGGSASGGSDTGGSAGAGNCPGPGEGVLVGNSNISGIASVDTLFASIVALDVAAQETKAEIREHLDAVAISLGLVEGSTGAEIAAALDAKMAADLDEGLSIESAPVTCKASAADALDATAACDDSVEPLVDSALCVGSCDAPVDGVGNVDCPAEATLTCMSLGTVPDCEGLCYGACELSVAGACEGTCQGTCSGTCAVEDGEGACDGPCDGECTGTCVVESGDACTGECAGECVYEPPDSSCEVGSDAACESDGFSGDGIECAGLCEGIVEPPDAIAECEASAKADARLAAACALRGLDATFQFSGALDENARADFLTWLEEFEETYADLLVAQARADVIVDVATDLSVAASGPVKSSWLAADPPDAETAAGLACALAELPDAVELLGDAASDLASSIQAVAQLAGPVND